MNDLSMTISKTRLCTQKCSLGTSNRIEYFYGSEGRTGFPRRRPTRCRWGPSLDSLPEHSGPANQDECILDERTRITTYCWLKCSGNSWNNFPLIKNKFIAVGPNITRNDCAIIVFLKNEVFSWVSATLLAEIENLEMISAPECYYKCMSGKMTGLCH